MHLCLCGTYANSQSQTGLAIGGWVSYAFAARNEIAIFRQDGAFNLDSTASPLSGRKGIDQMKREPNLNGSSPAARSEVWTGLAVVALGIGLLVGCAPTESQPDPAEQTSAPATAELVPRVERVLTEEERDLLTPDDILQYLVEGNERFVAGSLTVRDHTQQVRDAANGQFPKAIVLSCVDSRVPVEDVFDRGIGDLFVARVAGNFENTDILGSMEFACAASGAKLILVLGHGSCGAVVSAIDGVELGNITPMLENIQPAIDHFTDYEGDKTGQNAEFVAMVTEESIRQTLADIRTKSPVLAELEASGDLKIVGGVYDMHTGRVEFLDDAP